MADTKHTRKLDPPRAEYVVSIRRIEKMFQRSPVARLFESWAVDLEVLTAAVARQDITPDSYLEALPILQQRLRYYAPGGELERDVTRLAEVLAGIDPPSRPDVTDAPMAGVAQPPVAAFKQDGSAPEYDSGTEVANTNSNSNSKRIRKSSS